ncbi:hypothetical protein GCM10011608_60540 [Micromonospora sonchi]|uniref:Uncharacterized protein n=1 Tax=Micromonospora sonchi TaxID=1763543 RepID=A0A917X534_9ACTN|nr:hypothetical protein GCM10011608_60540 [Micromonospora sonchi]
MAEVLDETGQAGELPGLLRAAADATADEIAALTGFLDAAGRSRDVDVFIEGVLASVSTTSRLISVVAALWLAGQTAAADKVLQAVATHRTGEETVAVADALRDAGRQEVAFRLYLAAIDTTARRPADTIAQLTAAMRQTGHAPDSERLIDAAATAAAGRDLIDLLSLIETFNTAGQPESSRRALAAAATTLAVGEVLELAAKLRTADQPEEACQLCLAAAEHRSLPDVIQIFQGLQEAGRPVDANRVLDSVTQDRTGAEIAAVAATLREQSHDREADRLTEQLMHRPPTEIPHILSRLGPQDRTQLLDAITIQPPDRLAATIVQLYEAQHHAIATGLLERIVRNLPAEEILAFWNQLTYTSASDLLGIATEQATIDVLRKLLDGLSVDTNGVSSAMTMLLNEDPLKELPALLRAFRRAGMDDDASHLAERFLTIHADDLTEAVVDLTRSGDHNEVDVLIEAAVDHSPVTVLVAIIVALDNITDADRVDRLLAIVPARRSEDDVLHLTQLLHADNMRDYADELQRARRNHKRGRKHKHWWN